MYTMLSYYPSIVNHERNPINSFYVWLVELIDPYVNITTDSSHRNHIYIVQTTYSIKGGQ